MPYTSNLKRHFWSISYKYKRQAETPGLSRSPFVVTPQCSYQANSHASPRRKETDGNGADLRKTRLSMPKGGHIEGRAHVSQSNTCASMIFRDFGGNPFRGNGTPSQPLPRTTANIFLHMRGGCKQRTPRSYPPLLVPPASISAPSALTLSTKHVQTDLTWISYASIRAP